MSNNTDTSRKRVAHCCCGSLSAETTGEPEIVVACACVECQRRTGSAFGVSTYWVRENVRTSGFATRYVREGQKGRRVVFYFCAGCGSTVYWEIPDLDSDQVGVALGAFADPKFPAPTLSGWERTKHDWVAIPVESHSETQNID
jgi:hypothetical protein